MFTHGKKPLPIPSMDPKYALLIAGLATGAVTPETAVRVVANDLQASGVDLRGMVAQLRITFARSQKALDAIEKIFGPESPAQPTITVRQVFR